MERHRCKLCHRRFANGRALGGHMKAHLATPTDTHSHSLGLGFQQQHSGEAQDDEEEEEEKALGFYALRENPKRSLRFAHSDLSVVQETGSGSDTESSRRHARRRSKRKARAVESPPVSSVSDGSPEEDVAMCLMMLSRDVWRRRRGRHRCHKCNKAFRSHQAMRSHNTICFGDGDGDDEAEALALALVVSQSQGQGQRRVFRCPYCCKVFGSGQALGGHKRSCHHIQLSSASTHKQQPHCFIDLNLPAPPSPSPFQQHHFSLLSDA